MKKFLILLVACTTATLGLHASCDAATSYPDTRTQTVKGSGRMAVRTTRVEPFREVEASRGVQVVLTEGTPGLATISADDNLLEHVFVRSVEKRLVVGLDPELKSVSHAHITITLPTDGRIRLLEASSNAGIESQVVITGPELRLKGSSSARLQAKAEVNRCAADASSGADIEAHLCVEACSAHVTSGARIEFSGTADRCEVDASSGSKFNGHDLAAIRCKVQASSGANASVHCTGQIDAHASSGGHITYRGTGTGSTISSSGGSIRKR